MDNGIAKQTLEELERIAVEGAHQVNIGTNQLAIALHEIASKKLYLEVVDETGLPVYHTFKDYLEGSLLQQLNISRSWVFELVATVKIATGPTLNLSLDDFVEFGGVTTFRALKDVVDYNPKTGEITNAPETIDEVRFDKKVIEALHNISPGKTPEESLSPSDMRKELAHIANKKNIYWRLSQENGDYVLESVVSVGNNVDVYELVGPIHDADVVDNLKKLLKIQSEE